MFDGRHPDVVEHDLGMAVRRVVVAEHRQHARIRTPGVSIGTRIIDCCVHRARPGRSCP
jgi:hypothetical protein